jgi:SAM-dependent methyltransferase
MKCNGVFPEEDNYYRAFVGVVEKYDIMSALQFNVLTLLGLRENHYLLDIGCGSLRAGRLFIPYLLPNHYFGIEPEKWLVEEGIEKEMGNGIIEKRNPSFIYSKDFNCTSFNQKFDFIIAQSVFTHASQGQIKTCLNEVSKCMTPKTIFVATVKYGRNYAGNEWVYPNCIQYKFSLLKSFAQQYNMDCQMIKWFHGQPLKWLVFTPKEYKLVIKKHPVLKY